MEQPAPKIVISAAELVVVLAVVIPVKPPTPNMARSTAGLVVFLVFLHSHGIAHTKNGQLNC